MVAAMTTKVAAGGKAQRSTMAPRWPAAAQREAQAPRPPSQPSQIDLTIDDTGPYHKSVRSLIDPFECPRRFALLRGQLRAGPFSRVGPGLLLIPPANRVGGGCCSEETGRPTSRSAFVQVVGLLNTYLPLTVTVFMGKVKWFTAVRVGVPWE